MAISIYLIIIIIFLFIYNLINIYRNKWVKVFGLFIILLTFIPTDAIGLISGISYNLPGYFNISIAGYDTLIVLFISIFKKGKNNKFDKEIFLKTIVFLILMLSIRLFKDGLSAPSNKMLDNYFLPIIISLIAINRLTKKDLSIILELFYKCILINAFLAIVEYWVGKSLFFHSYYLNNINWYKSVYISTFYGVQFRSTSCLGHPLINGIYFILAFVYYLNVKGLQYNLKSIVHFLILSLAIYTTNSRMIILIFMLYFIYYLINSKRYLLIFIILIIGVLSVAQIDLKELYLKIFIRDKSGSSLNVRLNAIRSLTKIPLSTILFGTGYNNTYQLLESLNFVGNFEISYLIILVENGIISFILWIRMMALLGFKKINESFSLSKCIKHLLIVFLIVCLTSNSIADPGSLNYVLWIIIAFQSISSSKERIV